MYLKHFDPRNRVSVFTRAGTTVLFVIGPFDATVEGVDFAAQTVAAALRDLDLDRAVHPDHRSAGVRPRSRAAGRPAACGLRRGRDDRGRPDPRRACRGHRREPAGARPRHRGQRPGAAARAPAARRAGDPDLPHRRRGTEPGARDAGVQPAGKRHLLWAMPDTTWERVVRWAARPGARRARRRSASRA